MLVLVIELDAGVGLLAGVEVLGVCFFFCLFLLFADEFVDVVLLLGANCVTIWLKRVPVEFRLCFLCSSWREALAEAGRQTPR